MFHQYENNTQPVRKRLLAIECLILGVKEKTKMTSIPFQNSKLKEKYICVERELVNNFLFDRNIYKDFDFRRFGNILEANGYIIVGKFVNSYLLYYRVYNIINSYYTCM